MKSPLAPKFQHVEDGAMGLLKCMLADDVQSGDLWGPDDTHGGDGSSGLPVKIFPDFPECTGNIWDIKNHDINNI